MDVSRGDRVLSGTLECEVLDGPDPKDRVSIRRIADGNLFIVHLSELSPVPPDVVTLTLSYRGREVTEEMTVPDWRWWVNNGASGSLPRAARALAEKVDSDD